MDKWGVRSPLGCVNLASRGWFGPSGVTMKRAIFAAAILAAGCASTACSPLEIASGAVQVATFDPTPTKQKTITIAPQAATSAPTVSASTVSVSTGPSAPYLNILDGNAIYPIEGAKNITLHAAPASPVTTTNSGEIHNSNESLHFTRVITGTNEIDATGQNFAILVRVLTDTRSVMPTTYQSILDKDPSFAGIEIVAIADPFGKIKSIHGAGGVLDDPKAQQAMAQFSSGTYTGTIELPVNGLAQGSTLEPKLEPLQDAEMMVFQTVEGRGTYRGRSVIVLKDDGGITRNGSAIGRVFGFAFLDESVGIVTYESDNISFQIRESGDTSITQIHSVSAIDLP
jgi:hypothetical protein